MKGIYTLVIELNEKKIQVGALGDLDFEKGYYVYVGSAQNGLETRIDRHLRDDKKKHWHIDHLLDNADIVKIYIANADKEEECVVAKYLDSSLNRVNDFGASDCSCNSHLFYSNEFDEIADLLKNHSSFREYNVD